jgi:uncharacterized membrane protein
MLTIFAAAVGFLFGGLYGAAWAVVVLYLFFVFIIVFAS